MVTESINVVTVDLKVWVAFIGCAILGGLASSLINNNKIALMPGWDDIDKKTKYRMGFLSDVTLGMAAAIGILWTMTPQTLFQLLGIGVVAGYGGSSILQALVNRLATETVAAERDKIEKEKQLIEKEKQQIESKLETIKNKEEDLDKKKAEIQIMKLIQMAKGD